MKDKKYLLIYSGGMDSTTLLYQYKDKIKLCISFDYGSKHNNKEFNEAAKHTNALMIPHIRIPLSFVNKYFKSDLLKKGGEIPEGHYEDLSMKRTVVPFRNGIMLSIAVGIAESNDLNGVLIANHFGDHAIYPDCRKEFIESFNTASEKGTYKKIKIVAPYTNKTKRQVALIGKKMGVDYNQTWSCYKGKTIHCGVCGTCVERKEALQGFDNTKYKE